MTRNEIIVSYIPFIEEYIETVDSSLERDDLLAIAYEAIVDAVDSGVRDTKRAFVSRFRRKLSSESNFENIIAIEDGYDIDDDSFAYEAIEAAISSLSEKEGEILKLLYFENKTLKETGDVYGVSLERIRQIEAKAIRKLRHPSRSNRLRGFYGVASF